MRPPTPSSPTDEEVDTSFSPLSKETLPPAFTTHESVLSDQRPAQHSEWDGLGQDTRRLPCLMIAASAFSPSLEDELLIQSEDIVLLLEEYDDGWCLVQQVEKPGFPQGTVPRICLKEYLGATPLTFMVS
jgi:hypothetical protein